MKTGVAISGAAHAALIALVVLGLPWFSSRSRPPIPVTEVSFVSEADFDRAQATSQAPRTEDAAPRQARPVAPPPRPKPEPAPEPKPEPAPEQAPEPDPNVASLAPAFNPESPLNLPSATPDLTTPSVEPPAPLTAAAPPRARPRLPEAPEPSPPQTSPQPVAPRPEPASQPTTVPRPQTQPSPEATPDTPEPESLALESSARPLSRKGNLAEPVETQVSTLVEQLKQEVVREQRRQATERPEPDTAGTPATEPTVTEPTEPARAGDGSAPESSLPEGPPITNSEKDGLRLAVQRCWVVPAGVRDASELRVVLSAQLQPDGSVLSGSIRLVEPNPVPDSRFQAAYDAGRRALIRCSPYSDLPREKYAQWRTIEVVFNPKGMVSW